MKAKTYTVPRSRLPSLIDKLFNRKPEHKFYQFASPDEGYWLCDCRRYDIDHISPDIYFRENCSNCAGKGIPAIPYEELR